MNEEPPPPPKENERSPRLWPRVLVFVGIVWLWMGLSHVLSLDVWLLQALRWIEGQGVWGMVVFVLLYVPVCIVLFPDILTNVAAGAIWGVVLGTVVCSIGRVVGSTVTFLLVRGLAGRWIERRLAKDPDRKSVV